MWSHCSAACAPRQGRADQHTQDDTVEHVYAFIPGVDILNFNIPLPARRTYCPAEKKENVSMPHRNAPFLLVMAVVLGLLSFAQAGEAADATKQYVLHHPNKQHCKAHYVKRVEHVTKRVHGRKRQVRETVCVRIQVKPKAIAPIATPPKATVPAAIPSPTPGHRITLHSHLDPSFVQDPQHPFDVTYSFSASATQVTDSLSDSAPITPEEPASLPAGYLNLYNDGSLACSINVGGDTTGGECPVTYTAPGEHKIVVTYTAGEISATETNTEVIERGITTITITAPYVSKTPSASGLACREYMDKCTRWAYEYYIGNIEVTERVTNSQNELLTIESYEGFPFEDPRTIEIPVNGYAPKANEALNEIEINSGGGSSVRYTPKEVEEGKFTVQRTFKGDSEYLPSSSAILSVPFTPENEHG
jgi:hypothetical protein